MATCTFESAIRSRGQRPPALVVEVDTGWRECGSTRGRWAAHCVLARRWTHGCAQQLVIGEGTVKTHIGRIFDKLGLRDCPAAIVFAFDHGVVQAGG
jgi:hypothetical protein